MATVSPSTMEGPAATTGCVETVQVVQAMFKGLAQRGASRQVVAAAAAAVFRSSLPSCRRSELDHTELVAVPREVVDKVRPVADAMAVQGIVGDLLGAQFHSTGQAYEALRQHEPAFCRPGARPQPCGEHRQARQATWRQAQVHGRGRHAPGR